MKYWKEFQTKWGFDDGDALPDDADLARAVYIQAVNLVAKAFRSRVRAVAYSPVGFHNPMRIIFIPAELAPKGPYRSYMESNSSRVGTPFALDIDGRDVPELPPDPAMQEAVRFCQEQELDAFLARKRTGPAFARFKRTLASFIRRHHREASRELKAKRKHL